MALKTVKYILPATMIDMGGMPVKQALPTHKIAQVDPFLLLHHARVKPLANLAGRAQGVGPHPHRGFSPVTFVIEGEVHHRDSHYNDQIAKAGEVQWMHAGFGIVHSERPSEALVETRGHQEIVQVWINSPANRKMVPPSYQHLTSERMPHVKSDDQSVNLRVVAGEYQGLKSATEIQSPLMILWGRAEAQGKVSVEIPKGFNACIYLVKGNMRIEGHGILDKETLAIFNDEGSMVNLFVSEDTAFLVLSGEAINEKVVQNGPYVMNSETEILEAMRDYQMGKMGILIES